LPHPPDFIAVDYDDRDLHDEAPGALAYGLVKAEIGRKTWWTTLQKSLTDQLVRTKAVEILVNPDLKAFSRVGETPEQFAARCAEIAGAKADAEIAALQKKYDTKLRALRTRFDAAAAASQQASARHEAEYGTAAQVGTLLGGLFGGRRSRTSISSEIKRSATSQTRVDAAYGKASVAQQAIVDLEAELQAEVGGIDATWTGVAANVETMSIPLEKTDVAVTDLRLVWVPVS
jgi:N-acetylglucosamine kinase-like BadF-type ATPase